MNRLEGLQLPGEGLDGEFWSVSALTTVAATHSLSLAMWQAAVHVFLGQLAHSLQQPEWTKRTLSSKPGGSVLWSLIATSHRRGAKGRWSLLQHFPPLLQAFHPPADVTSGGFKEPASSPLHSFRFPFWEADIKE